MKIHPVTARAPVFAAPFCARRRDMGSHHCAVEHLDDMGCLTRLGQKLKEGFEDTSAAEAPEALPDTVPVAEFHRQGAPGDAVQREIMQCFQKLAIVPSRFSPA